MKYTTSAAVASLVSLLGTASAASTLFTGGTIVAFDEATQAIRVVRGGSLLVVDDRIAGIFEGEAPADTPGVSTAEVVNATDKIITPGFIDTHRHGWQTAFKTLGSNTSLVEYYGRYGEYAAAGRWEADDVYVSQLAGLYEAANAGVTTTLDHAHSTWDPASCEAGLKASIDSGSRVFYAFAFHNTTVSQIPELLRVFRDIADKGEYVGTPTSLGIAYDAWGPNPNKNEVDSIMQLTREYNISVITTHSLQGPWGYSNSPSDIAALGYLNITTPVVFSHASFLTAGDANLLRQVDQHVSVTPESEMHYGHTHPVAHLILDQAALGVDTHFTFSTDVLTQARLWLQQARHDAAARSLAEWDLPRNSAMSADQAFLLATRSGGRALRRPDLGVLAVGAKADVVVWDGASPALLGWADPVAAVMLHASVGDVESVMVDGRWVKRDRRMVVGDYADVRRRFLVTAKKIQDLWKSTPLPTLNDVQQFFFSPIVDIKQLDVQRGEGNGYGTNHF